MSNDKVDTKKRILEAAKQLFAEKGFDGTSVREIAEASGSNVSAINYHFRSKQGLYWALLMEAFDWVENGIKSSCERSETFDQLTVNLYEFLTKDPSYIRSTMKSMLTDSISPPESTDEFTEVVSTTPGMPGYRYIADFAKTHLPEDTPEEAIFWAVNSVFSSIIHMALMSTTLKFKLMQQATGGCEKNFCLQHLIHLGRAALQYATSHHEVLKAEIELPNYDAIMQKTKN